MVDYEQQQELQRLEDEKLAAERQAAQEKAQQGLEAEQKPENQSEPVDTDDVTG